MEKPRDFIEHRQTEARAFDRGGGREGGGKQEVMGRGEVELSRN